MPERHWHGLHIMAQKCFKHLFLDICSPIILLLVLVIFELVSFRELRATTEFHDVSLYIDSQHTVGAHKV